MLMSVLPGARCHCLRAWLEVWGILYKDGYICKRIKCARHTGSEDKHNAVNIHVAAIVEFPPCRSLTTLHMKNKMQANLNFSVPVDFRK